MLEVLGNRQMCLARELTKVHEEYIRGTIEEVLEVAATCKGEMVIVMDGFKQDDVVFIQPLRKWMSILNLECVQKKLLV